MLSLQYDVCIYTYKIIICHMYSIFEHFLARPAGLQFLSLHMSLHMVFSLLSRDILSLMKDEGFPKGLENFGET